MRNINIRLDPGGGVEATIEDPEGNPFAGATVAMMRRTYTGTYSSGSHAETKITGADGKALFEVLPSTDAVLQPGLNRASVDIEAWHDDFDPAEQSNIRIDAGKINRIVLQLKPKDRSGVYEGFVYDSDRNPIEEATVQVQHIPIVQQATDALGYFRLENLRPGRTTVLVERAGYRMRQFAVEIPQMDAEIVLEPTTPRQ